VGGLVLLFAMVKAYHELRIERDTFRDQIARIEASGPYLECSGQKFVGLFGSRGYLFHVLQVWLANRPEVRTLSSLAKNVSVRVTFYRAQNTQRMFSVGPQWVKATDPDNAGFNATEQSTDIPANDIPAKFILLLHHLAEDIDCFAHSFGKLQGQPDGRHPPYRLPPGQYRVAVKLTGDNVDQEFPLRLVIHGKGIPPQILGVPEVSGFDDLPVEPSRAADEHGDVA
jgi:hypothetical protein